MQARAGVLKACWKPYMPVLEIPELVKEATIMNEKKQLFGGRQRAITLGTAVPGVSNGEASVPNVRTGLRMQGAGHTDPDMVFEDVQSGLKLVQHYGHSDFTEVEDDEGDEGGDDVGTTDAAKKSDEARVLAQTCRNAPAIAVMMLNGDGAA